MKIYGLFLTWIQEHMETLAISSPLAGYLFQKRVDQIILNHVFKAKSGQSPDYKVEHFITASFIHSDQTRFMETRCFFYSKSQ